MEIYKHIAVEILPIFLGMIILSYAVYLSLLLYKKIPKQKLKKAWLFQTALSSFFCVGYLAAIILNTSHDTDFLPIIIAFVFFFGAIYVLTLISITSALTRDLVKFNSELEEMIELRTHELEQSLAELQSTQEQLLFSKTLSAYSDIAGQIAHEFNTPITSIQLLANQLLNEETLSESTLNKIRIIHGATTQLEKLTGAFRRLYRTNQNPLDEENVKFYEILESLLILIGEQLARTGIGLKTDFTISHEKQIKLRVSSFAQITSSLINYLIDESQYKKERNLNITCYENNNSIYITIIIVSSSPKQEQTIKTQPFDNFHSIYKSLGMSLTKLLIDNGTEHTIEIPL